MLARALTLVTILAAAGCGADRASGSGGAGGHGGGAGGSSGETCATLAATCIADQKGCVETNGSASCVACDPGSYAAKSGRCEAIGGTPLEHDFPMQTVQSGQEQLGNCRSWTLHNEQAIWVNAVELLQDEDSHHSNWTFGPDSDFTGPDGIWACGDRGYEFYAGVAAGGVIFNQSTQATHEVQKFPDGAAVRLPPHTRIISDIHLLNTSSAAVTGNAKLTLYTVAKGSVDVELKSFHVEYDALDIPPHATARFTGQCDLATAYLEATGQPFAPKVYYLLPHTHTLSTRFFAKVLGGPRDGETLLDDGPFDSGARGRSFDPPVDLKGSLGLTFACQYLNPRATSVGWGLGDQEMCELFGFADAAAFIQARVETGHSDGTKDGVEMFSGSCVVEQPTP